MTPANTTDYATWRARLAQALHARRAVIADTAWRDRDPVSHLDALREASERIAALSAARPPDTDPKLAHYLERCSFDKALAALSADDTTLR